MADHYTYRVSWSDEDRQFVATCTEFPSLSVLEDDRAQALAGIEDLVADVVAEKTGDAVSSQSPSNPIRAGS